MKIKQNVGFFKITWTNGDSEVMGGANLLDALKGAGYGPAVVKIISHSCPIEATDEQTKKFIEVMSQSSEVTPPDWKNISDEGRAEWRRKAGDYVFRKQSSRPDRFPIIK